MIYIFLIPIHPQEEILWQPLSTLPIMLSLSELLPIMSYIYISILTVHLSLSVLERQKVKPQKFCSRTNP